MVAGNVGLKNGELSPPLKRDNPINNILIQIYNIMRKLYFFLFALLASLSTARA